MSSEIQPVDVPRFLDFEASSLSATSYPIEVAWNVDAETIECHLISPASVPFWTDWSRASEAIHGISRAELLEKGLAPAEVCERLRPMVEGQTIHSDAPQFERIWLRELFRGAGEPHPEVRFRHADRTVYDTVGEQFRPGLVDELKRRARELVGGEHRADLDVRYMIEAWRLACGVRGY